MIDDLLNYYLALEKAYISNAFANGLNTEQATFIIVQEKETQIERAMLDWSIDSNAA